MDDTVYKLAIAGFMHDIGKFAERADMPISEEYINNNAGLYQPYYNNHFTHKHAIYTAAFIERYKEFLPKEFNKRDWGLEDSFINLAGMHHKPETPLQWIIAVADRVSSGFDRKGFEIYNQEIKTRDYLKTRLFPVLEGISLNDNWKQDLDSYKYRYELKELSPENIFPIKVKDIADKTENEAKLDYKVLFDDFVECLNRLWHKENIPIWFEHFENLFLIYTSFIPAATVGNIIPDVSLYDHSKITSAFASALYLYHKYKNNLVIEDIKNYEEKKFLIVSGDFYGIQDFIFSGGGSTGKASAKLLRGRSFMVSLLTELAADLLCRKIGIPSTSVVLNAAGRFTLIAHNTNNTIDCIKAAANMINKWLINNFYGQSSFGIAYIEASCEDFVSNNFKVFWEKLQGLVDEKRYKKFSFEDVPNVFENYLDSFNNTLKHPLCPFCGKRPAHKDAVIKISQEEIENACKICHDQIYVGEHLVKEDKIAIGTSDVDFRKDKLLEPLYGFYQLSFDVDGKLNELAKTGKLLKYWSINVKGGRLPKEITSKFINGYVPRYDDDDNYDDRLLAGKNKDKIKSEILDSIENKHPKTLLAISKKALNFTDKPEKFQGVEALGILKADIDDLGLIFSYGIKEELKTFSRIHTLSRQLNNFFTIYLPNLLANSDRYKDMYTVFAGGDELFLIGPWNKIIEFSHLFNSKFKRYVCGNPDVNLSAGISVHKPSEPIMTLAETSENALHTTKSNGKNGITIFQETVKWHELEKLNTIRENIQKWLEEGVINNAMLFRLNEIISMVKQEKEIQKVGYPIHIENMGCLKWRALLKYTVIRNVGGKLKGEEKNRVIDDVMALAKWLYDYSGGTKIPLWQIIYNIRKS